MQQHAQGGEFAQGVDVLASAFVEWNRHLHAVHDLAEDAAFLEVDVDGVGPAVLGTHQLPDFRAALDDHGGRLVHVDECAVDCPHAVAALEYPAAYRGGGDFRRIEFG
ncbi:hypothetical protein D3C80_1751910 [compost metagenome]